MRRTAVAASVLVAFMLSAALSGGSEARQGRASAVRRLETLTVASAPKGGTVVRTRTELRKGRTYRLVASDTITQTKTPLDVTGQTTTYQLDPLYCFGTSDPNFNAGGCSVAVPVYSPRLQLALPPSTAPVSSFDVATPGPRRPPLNSEHRYGVTFKAAASGPIYARVEPVPSVEEDSYSGAYRLDLYGQASPKKKKKRKRRQRHIGCPAPRKSSASARAAASCHWYVDFYAQQRGDPFSSYPEPPGNLVDTETLAVGKVFFNAEPRPGRSAIGQPAGVVVHTDTYQSPVPFSFDDGEFTLKPQRRHHAKYTFGHGEVKLDITMVVTEVSGVVYATDSKGHSTAVGDPAALLMRSEPPLHHDDFVELGVVCLPVRCNDAFTILHRHRYRVEQENKLRVRISRPKPLG